MAGLLQLSLSTVYPKADRLKGFYPAGIKALRFREETIYAIMAGPTKRQVPLPVPTPGEKIQQARLRHPKGSQDRHGTAPDGTGDPSQDPAITADAIRFGLRAPDA